MRKCLIVLLGICSMFTACNMGGGKQTGPTHYPFKESKKDRWGLVDANGKVLVENEFKEEPSPVNDGMFFAKTNGEFEVYSINNLAKTVGDTYKAITYFADGLAACVKSNEGIKYIDKKGDVKFELPLEYLYAKKFNNGYSLIGRKTEEHSVEEDYGEESSWLGWDAVNTSGEITNFKDYSIESVLSNGNFLVSEKKSSYERNYLILNSDGTVKTQLKDYNPHYLYEVFDDFISPDLKYYVYYDDDESKYGVRSMDGETILKAKYEEIHFLKNGKMSFRKGEGYDDEGWGVMDIKGNVLFKPRYSVILLHNNDEYLVGRDEKMALLNSKEDRLIGYEHEVLLGLTDKVFVAYDEGHKYELITEDGKSIASYSEFTLINNTYNTVKSDYFDAEACIKSLFSPSGTPIDILYGFYGMTPGDCADKMGISLNKDDIINNEWFPYQFLETNEYGKILYGLGFEKVVETYYDADDYWELRPRYSYSNKPCNYILAKLELNYEARKHIGQIKKQLEEVILSMDYTKANVSSNGYQTYEKPSSVIDMAKVNEDSGELIVRVYTK